MTTQQAIDELDPLVAYGKRLTASQAIALARLIKDARPDHITVNGVEYVRLVPATTRHGLTPQAAAEPPATSPGHGPVTARLAGRLGAYHLAPDFAGMDQVSLWMTPEEARAFLAEHEPTKGGSGDG